MSMKWSEETGVGRTSVDLVIDKHSGVIGTTDDHNCDFDDGEVIVRVVLNLHKSVWRPVTITANVSESYSQNARAEVEEVEVPADVLVKVTDRVESGVQLKAEGGFLSGLKKFVDSSIRAMYSEEDKRKKKVETLEKGVENLEKELENLEKKLKDAKQEVENARS